MLNCFLEPETKESFNLFFPTMMTDFVTYAIVQKLGANQAKKKNFAKQKITLIQLNGSYFQNYVNFAYLQKNTKNCY